MRCSIGWSDRPLRVSRILLGVSLMWLGHVPWAGRYWPLPFLTVLAPSERYHRQRGRRHKKLTDWARQMILQLRRWLPPPPPGAGGRQQLCRLGPAPLLPVSGPAGYSHRQIAFGRRPVRASATPSAGVTTVGLR